jgi:cytoskeletal protein CcmA (bactofilin family)
MWETKKQKVTQPSAEHFTVLGKDVTFKGIVHFQGTVQLDSCFDGEIHTKGVLVVGEHAVIRGTITVGTLISSGKIQGNVTAADKVQLLKSAVQIGDVQAPVFSIEEGAYFRGHADMGSRPSAEDIMQEPATGAVPERESGERQLSYEQVQEELLRRPVPH